ncbi:flagellar biosynthesis protein FlhB [Nesterenkonia sp. NBAIMH1]|uniref:EscU/YscU/HrcU family type III secretion system export apparatus switch protein n=1 Tax=Nesterenkonia sp. NBAIMH1 TaxID=2600320 RepID=UPI001FEEA15F|nr:EscU/YscU/HrcU family type III secretion system export apparatus switch protein [Nesterenkonia sp. NBAIMH1]
MSEPAGERTEKATPKRQKENREKGRLSRSQDLTAWVGIGAAAATMPLVLMAAWEAGQVQLGTVVQITRSPEPEIALILLGEALRSVLLVLWPLMLATLVGVFAAAALQGGVRFKKFALKGEHLQPVNGLKRVFGMQAVWQGAKALLKTAAVGLMIYAVVQTLVPELLTAGSMSLDSLLASAAAGVTMLLGASILAGVGLAVIDIVVVQKRNRKHTMMTRQEVKDETKKTDGDPLIRQQRRSRQMDLSRNRMIAAVADADVVLANPTHVAVALQYREGEAAPKVVAKGAELLAARIREEAVERGVPIVRDVPLARALHAECRLGQEVPVEHFTQVARVLAFVMALKRRGAHAGVHTIPDPAQGGTL